MPLAIERRLEPLQSRFAVTSAAVGAVLLALVVCAALFAMVGVNPLEAYASLMAEAFATERGIGYTVVRATPLILIALGTIVAWRTGFGYLGFEGCFVVGAAACTAIALHGNPGGVLEDWPRLPMLLLCGAASAAAGAAWAGLVGWLRIRWGGSEVLMSLMTNYIALLLVQYLVSGPLRAPGGLPQSARLPENSWLPLLMEGSRAHAGIFIALASAALVWLLLRTTPLGYEMVLSGLSPRAARYGGIAVGRRQLQAAMLAGALGALAGLAQVLGVQYRLMDGMSGGIGFIGIVVALLARLNPAGVVPVALLYGGLSVGADAMQRATGTPSSITFILQALIVLLVLASPVVLRWRVVWRGRASREGGTLAQGVGRG